MTRLLQFVLTGASLFIVIWTSAGLPDPVASHFDTSGEPDGYLARSTFVALAILVICGVPQLVMWLIVRSVRWPGFRVPNAGFWLAPERIAETERYVERLALLCGTALAAFLLFCHWHVVVANSTADAPSIARALTHVLGGLVLLMAVVFIGIASANRHFDRK